MKKMKYRLKLKNKKVKCCEKNNKANEKDLQKNRPKEIS